jgi:hypothetical protein
MSGYAHVVGSDSRIYIDKRELRIFAHENTVIAPGLQETGKVLKVHSTFLFKIDFPWTEEDIKKLKLNREVRY